MNTASTTISTTCLSIREAAQELGASERYVQRLIRSGKLPSAKIGNRVFIRETDLQDLLQSHLRGALTAADNNEAA